MRRRELIALLGTLTINGPFAAQTQKAVPVIGFLSGVSPGSYAMHVAAFGNGLSDAGYIEGKNVVVEYR